MRPFPWRHENFLKCDVKREIEGNKLQSQWKWGEKKNLENTYHRPLKVINTNYESPL